jgi:hypothetical protein
MRREDRLQAFFRHSFDRAFTWGECDCCLWVADWVRQARGSDPAFPLRGQYRTELQARRLVTRAGGPLAFLDYYLGVIGIGRTEEPELGDIGLLSLDEPAFVLGIRSEQAYWTARTKTGLLAARAEPLAAWRI